MSEIDKRPGTASATGDGAEPASAAVASPSKRRLIKLGTAAVPVAASLASRPVMAWSCQSPSAWGSEKINPATSLKGTQAHQSYQNEVWTIKNWKENGYRSAASGYARPWDVLVQKYPSCMGSMTMTTFNYAQVKIGTLCSSTGIANPGANTEHFVKDVLTTGSQLQMYTLVAQLNFLCLSSLARSEMGGCVSFDQLKKMATGSYTPLPGVTWSSAQITEYLSNNYIAVLY